MNRQLFNNRTVHGLFSFGVSIMVGTLLGLALGMVQSEAAYAQGEAGDPIPLSLEAPAQVETGQVISLTLRLQSPAPVAGFEAELRFDPAAAEFAGFYPQSPQPETSVGRLILPQSPTGSAVGYYTCTTAPCLQQRPVQAQAAAARDGAILAVVELLALEPGSLEIGLDHLVVVDAGGAPLPVAPDQDMVQVAVGAAGALHAAPAGAWPARTVAAPAVTAAAGDVTRSGNVSHADIMEIALEWQLSREDGDPCALGDERVDINGDGCVDIVDLQLAAAFAGSSIPQPEPDPSQQSNQDLDQEVTPASTNSTFVVNSTLDESAANPGNGVCETASGVCTLRAAIAEANAQSGEATILFDIPGDGVHTIQLSQRLPTLHDETGPTTIDGYSQPGASPNSDPLVSNAQIRIQLRGQGRAAFDGMVITAPGNTVRGLAFFNFKRAIWIYGAGAQDNAIVGNYIGTDAAGSFGFTTTSEKQAHGIHIEQGAYGNRIGGVSPEERNVVAGNARHGIGFWHVGTDQNRMLNNLIGLHPNGQSSLPNQGHGIDLNYGASRNIVGGVETGERNVISGNRESGAEVSHGASTTQNRIVGNYIGLDISGDRGPIFAVNGHYGVSLKDRVRNNLVADNVIGNNRGGGVFVDEFENCCASNNVLEGNRIGIGVDGGLVPNEEYGVRIQGTQTRIGPGNMIAYNPVGIQIEGSNSTGNTITLNSIFGNIGLGIDLAPLDQVNINSPNEQDSGPNLGMNYPEFDAVSPNEVTGTACGGCLIEVFIADGRWFNHGQGKTFVGSANATADGAFTVTLDNVTFGHYLTATATDVEGNTSEFSQNILVQDSSNQPPVAVDDSATTYAGKPVNVDVLANDSDAEGDPLFIVAVDSPSNGAATTDEAVVTYTPNEGFLGVDSFAYTISDNLSGISTATVTITVQESPSQDQVIVTPTEVSLVMGGGPESYTVGLADEPSDAVTITLDIEGQLTTDRDELIFAPDNWDNPQKVTVSLDEAETEGAAESEQSMIHHHARSADETYNDLSLPSVVVHITDPITDPNPVIYMPLIRRGGN